jgi:hypothetical protein
VKTNDYKQSNGFCRAVFEFKTAKIFRPEHYRKSVELWREGIWPPVTANDYELAEYDVDSLPAAGQTSALKNGYRRFMTNNFGSVISSMA